MEWGTQFHLQQQWEVLALQQLTRVEYGHINAATKLIELLWAEKLLHLYFAEMDNKTRV
jgi:hypothetical protein